MERQLFLVVLDKDMYTHRRVGLPRRTSVSSLGITEKLLKEDKVRGTENLLKIEDQPYLRLCSVLIV